MDEKIKASQFKAECLQIMDRVQKTRRKITITKRNVPIAKLVPIEEKKEQAFGKLKGSIHFKGNIREPIEEAWDANS